MFPTLLETPYQIARMMDRGNFALHHAWDMGEGFALEYWRGTDSNGACLRTLRDGDMVSVTHYATPGAAINILRVGGFPIPGVPKITGAADRDDALKANLRQLRAGLITCHRPA